MNIFISSDGCRLNILNGSQRLAPLTPLPIPGTNTIISKNSVMTNRYGAHFCQVWTRTRNVSNPASIETPMNIACRTRKCQIKKAAYLGESGKEIDAEYTITMPNSMSNTVTHTSGWSYSIILERCVKSFIGLAAGADDRNGKANLMRAPRRAPRRFP